MSSWNFSVTKILASTASQPNSIKYVWNSYLLHKIIIKNKEGNILKQKKYSIYNKYTHVTQCWNDKAFFSTIVKIISKMSIIQPLALSLGEKWKFGKEKQKYCDFQIIGISMQ